MFLMGKLILAVLGEFREFRATYRLVFSSVRIIALVEGVRLKLRYYIYILCQVL